MKTLSGKRTFLLALCFLLCLPAAAQKSISKILSPSDQKEAPTQADALGRQTPNGTLFGFLQTVQSGADASSTSSSVPPAPDARAPNSQSSSRPFSIVPLSAV
jgi:hypothetical protein